MVDNKDDNTNNAFFQLKNYGSLDAWRGIAALWVVFYHASKVLVITTPNLAGAFPYNFLKFGYLGVQLFFVISGFCIANAASNTLVKGRTHSKYLRARVRRIYPPMWIALIFYAIFAIIAVLLVSKGLIKSSTLAEQNPLQQGFLYWFANLTLTQLVFDQPFLCGVTWSLCYEVVFYLIVYVAIRLVSSEPRTAIAEGKMLGVLHGISCLTLIALIWKPTAIGYPFDLWAQFGLGIVVFDFLKNPRHIRPKIASATISLLIIVLAFHYHGPLRSSSTPAHITYIMALVFAMILVVIHHWDEQIARAKFVRHIASVGVFSYSLYLMHFLIVSLIGQAFRILKIPASTALFQLLFMGIIAIMGSWLFFLIAEKPFLKKHIKSL